MRIFSGILTVAVVGGVFLAFVPGCGGEDSEPTGMSLKVFGPMDDEGIIAPELDPFTECTHVKVCNYDGETGKQLNCTEGDAGKKLTIGSVEYEKEVKVSVECQKMFTDNESGKYSKEAVSRGQSCAMSVVKGKPKYPLVYMLPVRSFGPTYDYETKRETNPGTDARWGSTITELWDGRMLVAGGAKPKSGCDWASPMCVESPAASAVIYEPAYGTYLSLPATDQQMTSKRAFAAAVRLPSDEIAIFGGIDGTGQSTATIDIFDPLTETFKRATKVNPTSGERTESAMKKGRAFHTATLILEQDGGYVLLAGGYGLGEGFWELWNPNLGVVLEGKLGTTRWNHTATFVDKNMDPDVTEAKGIVVIAGGEDTDGDNAGVRDTIEVFDVAALIEQKSGYVPDVQSLCSNDLGKVAAAAKTMHGAALIPARHFLYLAGGFNDVNHANPTADICVFNYVNRSWVAQTGAFTMKKPRGGLSATSMPGNQILFAGGITKNGAANEIASTVEILFEYKKDGALQIAIGPEDETFPIAMRSPRFMHQTAMGCDGKVYFIGGLSGNLMNIAADATSEVYNP